MEDLTLAVQDVQMPKIEWNYEELKKQLEVMLRTYRIENDALLDESAYKDAKEKRATARKLLDKMQNQRKVIEGKYLKEWNVFKEQFGVLKGMVNEFIDEADNYAKEYEKQQLEQKKLAIEQIYLKCIGEFADDIPLEKIRKKEWDNKTYSLREIENDIKYKVIDARDSVRAIKSMHSKHESELMYIYFDTLSLVTVLARKQRLEELDRKRKEKEEIEELHDEYVDRIKGDKTVVSIQFNLTQYQLDELLQWCKDNDIEVFI